MPTHDQHSSLVLDTQSQIKVYHPNVGAIDGWRDLVGQAVARTTGGNRPTYAQIGATPFYAYTFAVNNAIQFIYHVDHDYAEGTPIYLHAHWCASGTNVQPVKWQFTVAYAHGHQLGEFPFTAPDVMTVEQTPEGVAYTHQIAEIADPGYEASGGFMTDGLLIVELKRITNGGTDNTDNIYLLTSDCHYRANKFATVNKSPDFNEVLNASNRT